MTALRQSVAFLCTGLDPGGAETQLVRIAVQLKGRSWDVHVISMLPPDAFTKELRDADIPVTSLNMRRGVPDPRALWRMFVLLRAVKPQVLACFMFHANLLGAIAGRIARVPVVISSIRTERSGGMARDKLERAVARINDAVVTNSRLVASYLVRRGVAPSARLKVIPNALALPTGVLGSARLRSEMPLRSEEFLWLAVGRFEEAKDYPTLLAALREVRQIYAQARLWIAGDGPLREACRAQTSALGMLDCVSLLGFRRDVPALLAAADGFVLCSAWEGSPNAVLEAVAAGKPIVATNVGGVPELVTSGLNGFLVPPRDPAALSNAMIRVMRLPEIERRRMGEAGRARCAAKHNLEHVVDTWESWLRELLDGNRRPGS